MRPIVVAIALLALMAGAARADEVTDAIEVGRKAYMAGELSRAKEAIELASKLIAKRHADAYAKLVPAPLPGWQAEEVQVTAVGSAGFGASSASRRYRNAAGDEIEVQITGDSAVIAQFAGMMENPQVAGAMGKIVTLNGARALQSMDGDLHIGVDNRFLVAVQGSGSVNDKLAYARAVDLAALSRM
jgi:hypothetical protein